MKHFNTSAMALITTACLSACGFMTPTKQYAGDELGPASVAVIRSHVGNPFGDEFHATISGYTKLEATGTGERKAFGLPGFTDYPKEIAVLPGEYEVQVYCFKGLSSFRPTRTLSLHAGHSYMLTCGVRDGQAFVEVGQQSS